MLANFYKKILGFLGVDPDLPPVKSEVKSISRVKTATVKIKKKKRKVKKDVRAMDTKSNQKAGRSQKNA